MRSGNRFWFHAKRFGIGWGPPATWQGWVSFIGWWTAFAGGVELIGPARPVAHTVFVCGMIMVLLLICSLKGEAQRRAG